MTLKDKLVLRVLVEHRANLKVLMDHEKNDLVYSNLEGARDAFSCAIALLRCPLRILFEDYNQIVNNVSTK